MEGWIKLYRKMSEWRWYSDPNTKSLFLHFLIFANTEPKEWRGQTIKRGQIITGRKELSKILGISEQSVRSSLARLKSTSEITINPTNKFSIITICNYESYQQKSTSKLTSGLTNHQPTTNQQLTTTKNIRIEEYKKEIHIGIYEYWNSKGIIKHKQFTDGMGKAIVRALKTYTEADIRLSFDKYAEVLSDNVKYYWTHKWTLQEFLDRGIVKFLDSPLESFLKRKTEVTTDPRARQPDENFLDWQNRLRKLNANQN